MSVSGAAVPQRIPRRVAPVVPGGGDRPRHLQLVDTDARRRERRRRWLVRIWAVGIVGAAFVGVGVHAFIAQGQMHVDTVDTRIARAQAAVQEARLAVAEAQSPAVIVRHAQDLGLTASALHAHRHRPGERAPGGRRLRDPDLADREAEPGVDAVSSNARPLQPRRRRIGAGTRPHGRLPHPPPPEPDLVPARRSR